MIIISYHWLKLEMHLEVLMFDINFISEPGIQINSSNDSWSFIHKRSVSNNLNSIPNNNKNKLYKYFSISLLCLFLILIINNSYIFSRKIISVDSVLNQVVDLIIESGYVKNVQLQEANFSPNSVKIIMNSNELNSIQKFTNGYRKEDKNPYEIFLKNGKNYLCLNFPWDGGKSGGSVEVLNKLASKTVFSNKISITTNNNQFELNGRSSDIISFLLQMAENNLIQKYNLSISKLKSGEFYLKIELGKV